MIVTPGEHFYISSVFLRQRAICIRKFEHHQIEAIFDIGEVESRLTEIGFSEIEYFVYGPESAQAVKHPELFANVIIKAKK